MMARFGVGMLYVGVSLIVAGLWTYRAKTENQENDFASIVAIADGSAPRPFVKRRLLCDAARVVATGVPGGTWSRASDVIDRQPRLRRLVRETLGWRRGDDPLLLSATGLIAGSAFGFMRVVRRMILQLYETTPGVADVAGLLHGLALLGGGGDTRFGFYPYDLPHTFIFTLGLLGVLGRRAWLLPVFALAAYSKETAVLLIPACLLASPRWLDRWALGHAAAMAVVFVAVRAVLDQFYGPGVGSFWFPGRNARWLAWDFAFDEWWYLPFVVVSAVRLWRQAPAFPRALRRLAWLLVPLVGLAFFKGWIEEKRQYLEMLPILGPLLIQWAAIELGWGDRLRARETRA